jgi:hypothetical protein
MTVACHHSLSNFIMTSKTGRHGNIFPLLVAVLTALAVRFMKNVPDQSRPTAAMGAVTGKTGLDFHRISGMRISYSLFRMTGTAQIAGIAFTKQQSIVRIMGSMTGCALPLGVWFMGMGILLRKIVVTTETVICDSSPYQPPGVGLVRRMTGHTFPLTHRTMDSACRKLLGLFGMAAITEGGAVIIEQSLKSGDMRVMTGGTLPVANRIVNNLCLQKSRFIMALEAYIIRPGNRSGAKKNDNNHKE